MTKNEQIAQIQRSLKNSLVIIGMMGAGKTTLARKLSEEIGWDFFDSDQEIEKGAGLSVSAIFETQGEAFFRSKEKEKIAELLSLTQSVISVGGGAITCPETADAILSNSLCLWIDAPIDILAERASRQNNRPLLKGPDVREILTKRMLERRHLYQKANLKIDGSLPIKKVTDNAIGQISDYLLQNPHEI